VSHSSDDTTNAPTSPPPPPHLAVAAAHHHGTTHPRRRSFVRSCCLLASSPGLAGSAPSFPPHGRLYFSVLPFTLTDSLVSSSHHSLPPHPTRSRRLAANKFSQRDGAPPAPPSRSVPPPFPEPSPPGSLLLPPVFNPPAPSDEPPHQRQPASGSARGRPGGRGGASSDRGAEPWPRTATSCCPASHQVRSTTRLCASGFRVFGRLEHGEFGGFLRRFRSDACCFASSSFFNKNNTQVGSCSSCEISLYP
jgi:hypothetical protein